MILRHIKYEKIANGNYKKVTSSNVTLARISSSQRYNRAIVARASVIESRQTPHPYMRQR